MRTVGKLLDHHRHPLDDGDPQRRRVLALHPCARHPANRRHPVGDLVGVDLQQRRAEPDLCGVEHLIAGHRPDPGDDDAAGRHRRREVEDHPERHGEHGQPDRRKHQLQAPDRPARNGFGRGRGPTAGPAFGLPAGLLDRHRALLRHAAVGAFAPRPPTGPLENIFLLRCGGVSTARVVVGLNGGGHRFGGSYFP